MRIDFKPIHTDFKPIHTDFNPIHTDCKPIHTDFKLLHPQYIREKYWQFEYDEVITPNIYNFELWKTSGHADHYKENMFSFNIDSQVKDGHCIFT
jgi:hypothetical protein